jgi:hypothetical protein
LPALVFSPFVAQCVIGSRPPDRISKFLVRSSRGFCVAYLRFDAVDLIKDTIHLLADRATRLVYLVEIPAGVDVKGGRVHDPAISGGDWSRFGAVDTFLSLISGVRFVLPGSDFLPRKQILPSGAGSFIGRRSAHGANKNSRSNLVAARYGGAA